MYNNYKLAETLRVPNISEVLRTTCKRTTLSLHTHILYNLKTKALICSHAVANTSYRA